MIEALIRAVIGALGWRIRGDKIWPFFGITLKRIIFWGIPTGAAVFCATGEWWAGLTAIPLGWLGAVPGYFGGQFDLANPANRNIPNYLRLSARGTFIALPVFLASLAAVHYELLEQTVGFWSLFAGAGFPIYYLLGLRLQSVKFWIVRGFTEWGELLVGFTVLGAMQ